MNKKVCIILTAALLLAVLSLYVSASGSDPLVSLSYLTEIFAPQLKNEIASQTNVAISQALEGLAYEGTPSYTAHLLTSGQRIAMSYDSEMVFRGGTAHFVSPNAQAGLCDLTTGKLLSSGDMLETGHIYSPQSDCDGAYILVTGQKASVLLRGKNEIS